MRDVWPTMRLLMLDAWPTMRFADVERLAYYDFFFFFFFINVGRLASYEVCW